MKPAGDQMSGLSSGTMESVGVVVIGRNEGKRLEVCLDSVFSQTDTVVYVDSGSTDGSVEYAIFKGASVVRLDLSRPFTAARARNEGFALLVKKFPQCEFVQFIDGDCELNQNWLNVGCLALQKNPSWGIVVGRVRERTPEFSLYNQLCDLEWNRPTGKTTACGGIFMARVSSFMQVGGFNPRVIAGEEPELCYRLRRKGWHIYRLPDPMALHDAEMSSFSQWWRRTVRGGYAYAQGFFLHGFDPREQFRLRETARIWFWAFFLPCIIVILCSSVGVGWSGIFLLYPLQGIRNFSRIDKNVAPFKVRLMSATFSVVDKWPQLLGQVLFWAKTLSGRKAKIIEYK